MKNSQVSDASGHVRAYVGVLLVLVSTIAVGIVPTAAKLAFEAGSNTLTVVTMRGLIGAGLIAACLAASGQAVRMSASALRWSLAAGGFYTVMAYSLIASIGLVTVNLVVVVYFTHPILVASIAHLRGSESLSFFKVVLIGVNFLGITLVLGHATADFDLRGIAFAAIASASVSGMILCSARAQVSGTSSQVNFVMTAVTVVIFASVTSGLDAWLFPETVKGWAGLIAAGAGMAIGLLSFFASFRYISATRATLLSTIEPVISILFAVAVLGERLLPWQWAGVAVVMASLIALQAI